VIYRTKKMYGGRYMMLCAEVLCGNTRYMLHACMYRYVRQYWVRIENRPQIYTFLFWKALCKKIAGHVWTNREEDIYTALFWRQRGRKGSCARFSVVGDLAPLLQCCCVLPVPARDCHGMPLCPARVTMSC